jgi:hypothetical protein
MCFQPVIVRRDGTESERFGMGSGSFGRLRVVHRIDLGGDFEPMALGVTKLRGRRQPIELCAVMETDARTPSRPSPARGRLPCAKAAGGAIWTPRRSATRRPPASGVVAIDAWRPQPTRNDTSMPDIAIRLVGTNWYSSNLAMVETLGLVAAAAEHYGGDRGAGGGGAADLHLVVAPEYMFRRSPMAILTDADLQRYSTGPHLASRVIPSSVSRQALAKGVREHTQQYGNRRTTLYSPQEKDFVVDSLCKVSGNRDQVIVPGTIYWEETPPQHARSGVLRRRRLTRGRVRNSCPVIHRGQLLNLHHKVANSNELDRCELDEYDFVPGDGRDGIVTLPNGLRLGVEICADHAQGRLLAAAGNNPLDVHIVVAAGMGWQPDHLALTPNGVGILCNGTELKVRQGNADLPSRGVGQWRVTV